MRDMFMDFDNIFLKFDALNPLYGPLSAYICTVNIGVRLRLFYIYRLSWIDRLVHDPTESDK